jgi:hypothetical protein
MHILCAVLVRQHVRPWFAVAHVQHSLLHNACLPCSRSSPRSIRRWRRSIAPTTSSTASTGEGEWCVGRQPSHLAAFWGGRNKPSVPSPTLPSWRAAPTAVAAIRCAWYSINTYVRNARRRPVHSSQQLQRPPLKADCRMCHLRGQYAQRLCLLLCSLILSICICTHRTRLRCLAHGDT